MKVEIEFTHEDLRTLAAEHCRKKFNIDPKNVEIQWAEPGGKNQYFVKVVGEYRPE